MQLKSKNCYGLRATDSVKSRVSVSKIRSTSKFINCSVPQGSILGPLLFVMYVNDLYLELEHCRVLMYADNTVIYYWHANSKNIEEIINKEV